MQKAYYRIEWDFLRQVLVKLGFKEQWIYQIMLRVQSISFSILLNGTPTCFLRLSRGLRQG